MQKKKRKQERELLHPDEFFFNKPPAKIDNEDVPSQAMNNLILELLTKQYN